MTKKILALSIIISVFTISCKNECDCTQDWDSSLQYSKSDLVSYDGKCWRAIAGGRGIEPGPWLENGNDIWEVCED